MFYSVVRSSSPDSPGQPYLVIAKKLHRLQLVFRWGTSKEGFCTEADNGKPPQSASCPENPIRLLEVSCSFTAKR